MSLINQMLKDLESRKGEGGQARAEKLHRSRSAWLPWALSAVLGVIVLVLVIQFYLMQQRITPAGPVEPSVAASSEDVQAEPVEPVTAREDDKSSVEAGATADEASSPAAAESVAAETVEAPVDATPAAATPADTKPEEPTKSRTGPTARPETPVAEKPAATTREATVDESIAEGSMSIAPTALSPREQAEASLQRGFTAMSRRDYPRAIDEFTTGLAILPRQDEARIALYRALRRQGRVAEAEGVLETGIADGREPHRFAEQLARNYAARGQVPMAVSLLAVAPPSVPADPDYHALWAALLQQQGDYAAARPIYESLVAVEPKNGPWLAGLGITQQQTGEPGAALESYRSALAAGGLAGTVEEYVRAQVKALAPEEDD